MAEEFADTGPLEAKNLTCIRGARTLFEDLSFTLKPGQGLIILGPNGSGKTSLLRILAGFLAPSSGKLSLYGVVADHGRKLTPGYAHYLGHSYALKPFLTVRENLGFWSTLLGTPGALEPAAKETGISALLDLPVNFLSEGQKKRVNLTRFLVTPLPIWLMDEPAAGLDREGRKVLKSKIEDHIEKGGIFIGATHQDLRLKGVKTITLGKARS